MREICRIAAAAYQLTLPSNPLAGRVGERLGRGTGSSLEFMDFRDYLPGDDLRHVDWRVYARTDQLKIRLYREEIAPDLDILLDYSASMAVTEGKEHSLRDLASALVFWAERAGGRVRLWRCGGGRITDIQGEVIGGHANEDLLPRSPLRPKGIRFIISDFLSPGDPVPVIRKLAAGAARLFVLQLLDPWERDPDLEGALTLVDCEGDQLLDLVLDEKTRAGYRERLGRLIEGVSRAVASAGGIYASLTADSPEHLFRQGLLAAGIVEPA